MGLTEGRPRRHFFADETNHRRERWVHRIDEVFLTKVDMEEREREKRWG